MKNLTFSKYWYLGFLGFVGFFEMYFILQDYIADSNSGNFFGTYLLWFLWFLNFIPKSAKS